MNIVYGPRGYSLDGVTRDGSEQFVFSDDVGARPPVPSLHDVMLRVATGRAIAFSIALG
jgi:hypothetical protein